LTSIDKGFQAPVATVRNGASNNVLLLVWSMDLLRHLAPFFYQGFFYGAGMENNAEASSDSFD